MNKQKLTRFINKYYLNGTVNSVVLKTNADRKQLSTRFISGDKTLLGEMSMDNWDFETSEIGIYSTDQLIKLLGVVDEDIRVHLTKAGDKAISLKINDSVSAVNYMLSDVSIINEPPQMKQIPNFELEINVTPSLIDKFISGKSALADEDKFTVITDGENTKLVIGYASVNTNRVTIPVTTNTKSLIDKISFNANLFKEVLSANKECESATLYVSSEGLAKITFKVDDFSSTYFFVAAGDID
jgi:hypothetical protein|tara:strand:- start:2396 stop:3121 length:726 start_codon:yes stop_codon:yes gene_type:complete